MEGEARQLYALGKEAGLKRYRFKSHDDLPRVHKALGFLRGIWPESLLDVGSGRGAFFQLFVRSLLRRSSPLMCRGVSGRYPAGRHGTADGVAHGHLPPFAAREVF